MKKPLYPLLSFIILVQCGLINNKKQNEPGTENPLAETLLNENQTLENASADSLKNNENTEQYTAFGSTYFGMKKGQAEQETEKRQLLDKYNYNVQNLYDELEELYAVVLKSDAEKAIAFDLGLKNKYTNLYKIIETKYGKPTAKRNYPSIFDVQKAGNYWLDKWETEAKQIQLGLQEKALNSYVVSCKIFDKNREDAELKRLKEQKNSERIEASKKF